MATLPMHYSYGMSVLNSHLIAGASLVLGERSVADPDYWDGFRALEATSFAGVPHSFELLTRTRALETPPPSLRYFTVAGGKLPPADVSRFAELAERHAVRFYVMYGQTEAAPRIAYVPPEIVRDRPEIIGRAIPGGMLSLVDDHGTEIQAAGEAGELVYRGPNVMMGYARDPADLAEGASVDMLHTGDIARRDESGLFMIVGRKSRFIKPFGLRIDLDDVERLLANAAAEVAVTGDDKGLVIAVVHPHLDIATMAVERLKLPLGAVRVETYADGLPRLPSGKRDYASILAKRTVLAAPAMAALGMTSLSEEFGRIIGRGPRAPDQSFADAGGDSLNFISAAILLEERLGHCPTRWEVMPAGQLDALLGSAASVQRRPGVAVDILARCACILLIVFHHSSRLNIDGAAASLLMLAGFTFGRFQPAKVEQNGFLSAIYLSLRKIVPIYIGIMLLYFALKRDWYWPNILFYANFTSGLERGKTVIAVYWFIEAYVHLTIAGSLLLALRPVQRFQASRGFLFGLLLIGAGVLAHALTMPDHRVSAWEQHSPFLIFYVFALGWAATLAHSLAEKSILSLVMIMVLAIYAPHTSKVGYYVIVPVYLMLLWANRVELTSAHLAAGINSIAHSSLYIYLVHPLIFLPALAIAGRGSTLGITAGVISAFFVSMPVSVFAGILAHRYSDLMIDRIETWRRTRSHSRASRAN